MKKLKRKVLALMILTLFYKFLENLSITFYVQMCEIDLNINIAYLELLDWIACLGGIIADIIQINYIIFYYMR